MQSKETDWKRNLFLLPKFTFTPRRYRAHGFAAWSGHLPFAHDLVAACKPSLVVELGTHYGESYFTFCQTVAEEGAATRCYAIDHWRGESHAGVFEDDVFEEVSKYNAELYSGFSYLLRSNFDDAAPRFQTGTIDILHIDGLHTYEAVRHDFDLWYHKVSDGGIVLLHDICVRHEDFGVWRLWEELEQEFKDTFAFHHSWGLGVLRKPGGAPSPFLDLVFERDESAREYIRRHYFVYASHLENVLEHKPLLGSFIRQADTQAFRAGDNGYSQEDSQGKSIEFEIWNDLTFHFPGGLGSQPLRIDPAHCTCVIEIESATVSDEQTGRALWQASGGQALSEVLFAGTARRIPDETRCIGLSTGIDPQLLLPALPDAQGPTRVSIRLRLSRMFDNVLTVLGPALFNTDATKLDGSKEEISRMTRALEEQAMLRRDMEQSKSWQLTRPFRSIANWIRTGG